MVKFFGGRGSEESPRPVVIMAPKRTEPQPARTADKTGNLMVVDPRDTVLLPDGRRVARRGSPSVERGWPGTNVGLKIIDTNGNPVDYIS